MGEMDEECVHAMEFTFAVLHYRKESIYNILKCSINYMIELYRWNGEKQFLELAEMELTAYLSMGLPLPESDGIQYLLEQEDIMEHIQRLGKGKKIRLCRSKVRAMIGKWMPSEITPLTIGQVVEDIIKKVKDREIGNYYYVYHRSTGMKDDIMKENRYELIITETECFFWDMNNFRFYTFHDYGGRKDGDQGGDSG